MHAITENRTENYTYDTSLPPADHNTNILWYMHPHTFTKRAGMQEPSSVLLLRNLVRLSHRAQPQTSAPTRRPQHRIPQARAEGPLLPSFLPPAASRPSTGSLLGSPSQIAHHPPPPPFTMTATAPRRRQRKTGRCCRQPVPQSPLQMLLL